MLKQLKNDERGIVFVMVLMIIIVMILLTISLISLNTSQVIVTEGEVQRIHAEALALGTLANIFSQQTNTDFTMTRQVGKFTYTVTANFEPVGSGPYNTQQVNIHVTF